MNRVRVLPLLVAVFSYSFVSFAYGFEREDALRAFRILGSNVADAGETCSGCHNPNGEYLEGWAENARALHKACLSEDLDLSAKKKIKCMKDRGAGEFKPSVLGLYTAGAHLPIFEQMFRQAYGSVRYRSKYQNFLDAVAMPRDRSALSAGDFAYVKAWFLEEDPAQPFLEETVVDGGEDGVCIEGQSAVFREYLRERSTDNWATHNLEQGVEMFACPRDSQDPLDCFKQVGDEGAVFPKIEATPTGLNWFSPTAQTTRLLVKLDFLTNFWTRSSADGRFVGNGRASGGSYRAVVTDLWAAKFGKGVRKDMWLKAKFDPSFFPDNSGFMFQSKVGYYCPQHILEDVTIDRIDFARDGCTWSAEVGLYQSVGASLGGADYFALTSPFRSENNGQDVGSPNWYGVGKVNVSRIVHNGQDYEVSEAASLSTPYLGDFSLSPSTKLTVSRMATRNDNRHVVQSGYDISRLSVKQGRGGEIEGIELEPMAQVCERGSKAMFSFDERFIVTHRTVKRGDHAELGYAENDPEFRRRIGTNNIYLFDLLTSRTHRLTTVEKGQDAKYPHFRSDGWIYFLLRDGYERYIVASDAAVRIGKDFALKSQ